MNRPNKNWLEWSVFAFGLVLVACVVGYLVYEGVTLGGASPQIEVRLGTPEQRGQDFLVPVVVENKGDETAGGLMIEVTLESEGAGEPERGEFGVALLPRRSTREGWVAFRQDPRRGGLKARVLGYEKP